MAIDSGVALCYPVSGRTFSLSMRALCGSALRAFGFCHSLFIGKSRTVRHDHAMRFVEISANLLDDDADVAADASNGHRGRNRDCAESSRFVVGVPAIHLKDVKLRVRPVVNDERIPVLVHHLALSEPVPELGRFRLIAFLCLDRGIGVEYTMEEAITSEGVQYL